MMKEAQAVPITRPALRKAERRNSATAAGKEGHLSPDCPKKDDIPRNEWAIHKAELHMQAEQGKQDEDSSPKTNDDKRPNGAVYK